VEIFLREKLVFAGFAERPKEVPAKPCKKSFWNKRLQRKTGLASNKNHLPSCHILLIYIIFAIRI
jgi:hypothetical protein